MLTIREHKHVGHSVDIYCVACTCTTYLCRFICLGIWNHEEL